MTRCVGPQPGVKLAVADVERDHASGAALQETVGEAAGRGAEVEAVLPRGIDPERVERVRELLAAARDEPRRPLDVELGVVRDLRARLLEAGHEPGEDERLRLGAALGEPALHEQDVESLAHDDVLAGRAELPLELAQDAGDGDRAAGHDGPDVGVDERGQLLPILTSKRAHLDRHGRTSGGTDREPVDELREHGRVGVERAEPLVRTSRRGGRHLARAVLAELGRVAVAVDHVVDGLEEHAELLAEGTPRRLLAPAQPPRPRDRARPPPRRAGPS